jgi:hypothetical protein
MLASPNLAASMNSCSLFGASDGLAAPVQSLDLFGGSGDWRLMAVVGCRCVREQVVAQVAVSGQRL